VGVPGAPELLLPICQFAGREPARVGGEESPAAVLHGREQETATIGRMFVGSMITPFDSVCAVGRGVARWCEQAEGPRSLPDSPRPASSPVLSALELGWFPFSAGWSTRDRACHPRTSSGSGGQQRNGVCLVRVAVAEGFEPSEAFTSHAFEACSLGRSDTPPPGRVPKAAGRARIDCQSRLQIPCASAG
jgi:hypothetical protein